MSLLIYCPSKSTLSGPISSLCEKKISRNIKYMHAVIFLRIPKSLGKSAFSDSLLVNQQTHSCASKARLLYCLEGLLF